MIRVGLYTPTPDGWVSQRTAHTTQCDARWCDAHGYGVVDMTELVAPGNSIEVGRNVAVQRAITAGCTHLRMLDADVWRPWGESTLSPLLDAAHEYGAVASGFVVEVHGGRPGKLNVIELPEGGHGPVRAVSAAAMLVDLRRLQALPWGAEPHFMRRFNPAATSCVLDEGFWFCLRARELGGIVVVCRGETSHRAQGSGAQTP